MRKNKIYVNEINYILNNTCIIYIKIYCNFKINLDHRDNQI